MYFGDSWGKWIHEYDYDQQTGQVKSGKQFHSLKDYPSPHFPDGSVINSQG
jgi:L-arabinonolactonase